MPEEFDNEGRKKFKIGPRIIGWSLDDLSPRDFKTAMRLLRQLRTEKLVKFKPSEINAALVVHVACATDLLMRPNCLALSRGLFPNFQTPQRPSTMHLD